MSSMRNTNQHRNHRERGQPLEREVRLGNLEKHKDYSLRSRNHNENNKRLKILRQKAAERNPDEFFYGMLSGQSRKGWKLADRRNPVLDQDLVKILKTQDAGYVNAALQRTKRTRARLEQEFVLNEDQGAEVLGSPSRQGKGSHKIFINIGEKQRQDKSDDKLAVLPYSMARSPGKPFFKKEGDLSGNTLVHWPSRTTNSRGATEHQELALKQDHHLRRKQRRKDKGLRESKLAALSAREKDLTEARSKLDLQRVTMSNSIGRIDQRKANWKVRERKK